MKTAEEWKAEHWDDGDYIITGFGLRHGGVYTRGVAEEIVAALKLATPLIQADAELHGWKRGMTEAAEVANFCKCIDSHCGHMSCTSVRLILAARDRKEKVAK